MTGKGNYGVRARFSRRKEQGPGWLLSLFFCAFLFSYHHNLFADFVSLLLQIVDALEEFIPTVGQVRCVVMVRHHFGGGVSATRQGAVEEFVERLLIANSQVLFAAASLRCYQNN